MEHMQRTAIIFCYAGEPEAAEVTFNRVMEAITADDAPLGGSVTDPIDSIRAVLSKAYNSPITKGLETLIGVRVSGEAHLYRSYEKKVINSHADCIGRGDSSVIRYLSEQILSYRMNRDEAVVVGAYLVSVANRYIDGCGGGPDIFFLPGGAHGKFDLNGPVERNTAKLLAGKDKRFYEVERKVGQDLRRFLIE
jgi:hypothetical protein